jgi:signal transduction histidine kinase
MSAPAVRDVIQREAWQIALGKYGAATATTVVVYEAPAAPILGPIHATTLFEAVSLVQRAPPMFAECVTRCLAGRDPRVIVEDQGVAVIGVRLSRHGRPIGAVVAGYGLTAFPEEATVRRFAQNHAVPLAPVWRAIRRQGPLTASRVRVYADLLAALVETLLSENFRAHEYERTMARLAETVEAKDQFLAMLAHELRNPLAPIRIAMQIIGMRETTDEAVRKARDIVDRQVAHLARLLDDLFDVSRITTGRIELRREKVNVGSIVADALEVSRSLIQDRAHSLSVSLPEESLFVDADPVRLEQVITNLVNNAARYTPPHGHIAVTAARENAEVVLRVRDDGIGIASHMLPRVFDLFVQGERSPARSEGGLGVGLTVVRKLVELHGGSVDVQSEGPGRGSEFVVRLPSSAAADPPAHPPSAAERAARALRILVVEDNPDGRDVLRTMLEIEGHDVQVAADGPGGVEAAVAARPDVAFIDIGLPGFDGYEVGRRVRDRLGRSVRLIALTGYGQAEDRNRSRDAGFDAHLVKPVSAEQLHDALAAS